MSSTREKEFIRRLDLIDGELREAYSKLELLYHIHERKADRLREMNIAPAFFGIVISALTTDTFISFSRLYDVDERSYSLWDFIRFVEGSLDLFTEKAFLTRTANSGQKWDACRGITADTIVKHRRDLRADAAILKRLNLRRSKRFAHKDREFVDTPEALTIAAPVSYADFRRIADTAFRVINSYSIAFNGVHLSIRPINLFDIDGLLDRLHFCRTQHNKSKVAGSA